MDRSLHRIVTIVVGATLLLALALALIAMGPS